MLRRARAIVVVAGTLMLGACGGGADSDSVAVPEGATFCSVFTGEYRDALMTSPLADESAGPELLKWAEVLVELAPDEIADEAADNVRFIEAFTSGASPDEFADGSFEFNEWGGANCAG
jgi:hypothetical protein